MLVYGTCNPEGYGDENYEGLYLTDTDIREITPMMPGIPVKIEHRGVDVGKVVSAWMHQVVQALSQLFVHICTHLNENHLASF